MGKLKVIVYTLWRGNIGYRISYGEWVNVLCMSTLTAKRKIKEHEEKGFLKVIRSKRHQNERGEVRQEINFYEIKKEKTQQPEKRVRQLDDSRGILLSEKVIDGRLKKRPNILDWNKRLDAEDMYIYLMTDCDVVKEFGDRRFKAISSKGGGKAMVESWKREAESRIERSKKNDAANRFNGGRIIRI
ncbi:TPA: hypothetical protein ACGXM6_004864 [Bacillus cereus]